MQCVCTDKIWKHTTPFPMNKNEIATLPKCPFCGGVPRPNILMFSDWSFNDTRVFRQSEEFLHWKRSLNQDELLVILEIGAGVAIPTIRNFGEKLAYSHPNAKLIRINPLDDEVKDTLGYGLKMNALEGIEALIG